MFVGIFYVQNHLQDADYIFTLGTALKFNSDNGLMGGAILPLS